MSIDFGITKIGPPGGPGTALCTPEPFRLLGGVFVGSGKFGNPCERMQAAAMNCDRA
jgi:hypothetical protein